MILAGKIMKNDGGTEINNECVYFLKLFKNIQIKHLTDSLKCVELKPRGIQDSHHTVIYFFEA